ncbi:hypothetical protein OH710_01205 [Pseudomonas capsici]|uniref:hypothetical protein n=1 Tax=Pseudomonas capsici TaxID=2810614 RepID=UPI0021F1607B|nr:hypothetical protein [Pseudomonas capsici]MCV4271246.1 hypothetical protein [Pseudomonas capsici]
MPTIYSRPTLTAGLVGLLFIAGCQSQTGSRSPEELKRLEAFSTDFRNALATNAWLASPELLDGDVRLRVKINRRNEVVFCETEPYSQTALSSVYPRLSALVKDVCWNTLFPVVPSELYDPDGTADIIAPLVFSSGQDTEELRLKRMGRTIRYAQSRFFWEQTLRKQPPSSIGYADFRYVANAQGEVQGCLVNLRASRQRPEAFELDGDLQARLSAQCKQMNLRQLPGFMVNPQGMAEGIVRVEYMPWKGGPRPL